MCYPDCNKNVLIFFQSFVLFLCFDVTSRSKRLCENEEEEEGGSEEGQTDSGGQQQLWTDRWSRDDELPVG